MIAKRGSVPNKPFVSVLLLSLFIFVFAGCATKPGGRAAIETPPGTAGLAKHDLSGQVVATDGKPVKGADVFLYFNARNQCDWMDRFAGQTRTDAQGHFVFKQAVVWEKIPKVNRYDSDPGYNVIARHPKLGISFAVVIEGDDLGNVTVPMQRLLEHTVKVKNVGGKPVEGARVYLSRGTFMKPFADTLEPKRRGMILSKDIGVSSGVTDAQGQVKLMGPHQPGFEVEKDGYIGAYRGNTVLMFPSARVSGKATYPDGAPAAGVAVTVEYEGNRLSWSKIVRADAEGNYAIAKVPGKGFYYSGMGMKPEEQKDAPGLAKVSAVELRPDSPYVRKPESFPIKPGDQLTKNIVLTRGLEFSGNIIDLTTGGPAKNLVVGGYFESGGQYLTSIEFKTDTEGKFCTFVPPGLKIRTQFGRSSEDGGYILNEDWLRQGNYCPFEGTLSEDMKNQVFRVKLWPVQTLKGTVVDAQGAPVTQAGGATPPASNALVYIHPEVSGVKTDDTGAFTINVAPMDRDFELMAISDTKDRAGVASLKAGTTEARIVMEPTKDYEGLVLTTEGLPAPNFTFVYQPKLAKYSIYRLQERITTDAQGRFKIKNLCPRAKYAVSWSADNEENRDYDSGSDVTIDLAALESGKPIQFEVKQYLNAMLGRVVNWRGEPIKNAHIEVVSQDLVQQSAQNEQRVTDEKGGFEVLHLTKGDVDLRISAEGSKTARVTAPSDSIDVAVTLQPDTEPVQLKVTVVDQDGKPVPNAPVELAWNEVVSEKQAPERKVRRAAADNKGTVQFTLRNPSTPEKKAGNQRLVGCNLKGHDVAYRSVRADEDTDVKLVVRKGGDHWKGQILDSSDKPIPGAAVRVQGMTAGGAQGYREGFASFDPKFQDFTYTTDAEGRFELARFSMNDGVSLEAKAPNYCKGQKWLNSNPGAVNDTTFHLAPGVTVKGKVVAKATGKPLTGFTVGVRTDEGRYYSNCELGKDGTFAEALKPGKYKVQCYPKDKEQRHYICRSLPEFTVMPESNVELVIEMEEGVRVSGTLAAKDTGKPLLENGYVSVSKDGERVAGGAVNKEDGLWDLYLYPGTFEIQYYLESAQQFTTWKTITVEAGKPIENLAIEVGPPEQKKPSSYM